MGQMTAQLPQFDVSEKITQNIMAAVEAERRLPAVTGQLGLLIPVSVAAVAGLVTLIPIDTMEGVLSTVISLAGLVVVKLLISGAKLTSDEVVA